MKKHYLFSFVLAFLTLGTAFSQAPVITSIQGPSNVCWDPNTAGTSFTANATNSPGGFIWYVLPTSGVQFSTNNNVVNVSFGNINATYTLYCFASNSSGNSPIDSIIFNVFEKPAVSFTGNQIICQGSSTNLSASPTIIPASSTLNSGSSTLFFNWSPATGLNTTVGPNVTANPPSSTNYTVQVMNGPCYDTAYFSLTVSPPPIISAVGNSTTICQGDSVQLTASGLVLSNSYYTWLNNGSFSNTLTVSPAATTNYTVMGQDSICSAFAFITIVVSPSPPINAISNKTVICKGESALLTASGLTSSTNYTWLNTGANSTTLSVSPAATTNYTVKGQGQICSGLAMVTVSVSLCTGIDAQVNALDNIAIYPNPSAGLLSIRLADQGGEAVSMQITNAMGQTVFKKAISGQESVYDLSVLPAGIYFVTLRQNADSRTIKLIRE